MDASNVSGGLQLLVDGMRGSPGTARSVADTLRGIPGVRDVVADPLTGRVAIRYEPRAAIVPPPPRMERSPARREAVSVAAVQTPLLTRIIQTVVIIALELALQRALGPLWPKRC
jgi:hypothetical protein